MTPDRGHNEDARAVAASVEALLAGVTRREPFDYLGGKSGAHMERIELDGEHYVLKYLNTADDWIMRATGDLAMRPIVLWRSGWLDKLPSCIDHTIVGAAQDDGQHGRGGAILMRDVDEWILPETDELIPLHQHLRFLDHMAQLHTTFWGSPELSGLLDVTTRYVWFGPQIEQLERAVGDHPVPTRFVPEGWRRFAERAPRSERLVLSLHQDPSPLILALGKTPATLVHGDWKASNLGTDPHGRTILIDWALPGIAPPCSDLAWYLCLNRARLPQPKEAVITAYREALERHGVQTESWWDRQLGLCLLGAMVQLGWEKALGDGPGDEIELAWWDQRASEGARYLQ